MEAQARLLRVLQEGEIRRIGEVTPRKVDVRLICATHRNLKKMVEAGQFREDLFYRLNVVELTVPALRERGSDIGLLAEVFSEARVSDLKGQLCVIRCLSGGPAIHSWPGNVRELENALERAGILAETDIVEPEHLGLQANPNPQWRLSLRLPLAPLKAKCHWKIIFSISSWLTKIA